MNGRTAWQGCWTVALLLPILLLAGCGASVPVRYYQLAVVREAGVAPGGVLSGEKLIGLGPVSLPEYLNRPQIVTRASANRLELADSHRWAEPLADNLPRVLAEDLALLLGTDRILCSPWPRTRHIDWQIPVQVLRFEGGGDQVVELEARWSLMGPGGTVILPERRSSVTHTIAGPGHEAMIAALSEALGTLAREIATAVMGAVRP